MKRNQVFKIVLLLIGTLVGGFILNSKIDKLILPIFLIVAFFGASKPNGYRVFFWGSLVFITASIISFLLNDPAGSLTYYMNKAAVWGFYFFAYGTVALAAFIRRDNQDD